MFFSLYQGDRDNPKVNAVLVAKGRISGKYFPSLHFMKYLNIKYTFSF